MAALAVQVTVQQLVWVVVLRHAEGIARDVPVVLADVLAVVQVLVPEVVLGAVLQTVQVLVLADVLDDRGKYGSRII